MAAKRTKKLRPNDRCHCGSGLKYKKCHQSMDEGHTPFRLPGHRSAQVNSVSIRAEVVEAVASPIPEWLLAIARSTAENAVSNKDTMLTIVLVATAAEAAVNRLLEPLIAAEHWDDLEQKRAEDKWKRLYRELGLPPLAKLDPPLASLLELVNLRNALVHFKHGTNVWSKAQPVVAQWDKGTVSVMPTLPLGKEEERSPKIDFHEVLRPARAPEYYGALKDILTPVLDAHPSDAFQIVSQLRAAMTHRLED